MRASEFDYALPPELIAQRPLAARDSSQLMVVYRGEGEVRHSYFGEFTSFLRGGDVLVLNDSRVIPARLRGCNVRTGGRFEILLLEESRRNEWWALVRPGKRARPGTVIRLLGTESSDASFCVVEVNEEGHRKLRFEGNGEVLDVVERCGEVPLPPYIERYRGVEPLDRERYQTVYAGPRGSVAAPTAGLHFTPDLLRDAERRGASICQVTLHVGVGTFAPVKAELVQHHRMHRERFDISAGAARAIAAAKSGGGRVFAVGTTSLRVLESVVRTHGSVKAGSGATDIFIYPPFRFQAVDALLTNFHLPRSTLLMLVSAFASPCSTRGIQLVASAYREAVAARYRFFSYGDAMLLI